MFEVGFTEIVLIFGIALLVLGPARLPKLAADLGRWAGRARAMARQLRTQLEQEVQFDPLATNDPPRSKAGHGTIHPPATPVPPADTAHAFPGEVAPVPPAANGAMTTGVTSPNVSAPPVEQASTASGAPLIPDTTVPDERKPG